MPPPIHAPPDRTVGLGICGRIYIPPHLLPPLLHLLHFPFLHSFLFSDILLLHRNHTRCSRRRRRGLRALRARIRIRPRGVGSRAGRMGSHRCRGLLHPLLLPRRAAPRLLFLSGRDHLCGRIGAATAGATWAADSGLDLLHQVVLDLILCKVFGSTLLLLLLAHFLAVPCSLAPVTGGGGH